MDSYPHSGTSSQKPKVAFHPGSLRRRLLARSSFLAVAISTSLFDARAASAPAVTSILSHGGEVVLQAVIPPGYRHAVLEGSATVNAPFGEALVAAGMEGAAGNATFRIPNPGSTRFLRLRLGTETAIPGATYPANGHFTIEYSAPTGPLTAAEKASHVLNRLAYGPSATDLATLESLGIAAYLDQQLDPARIDESTNTELAAHEAELFSLHQPANDLEWIAPGDLWAYFKGTQAPPAAWRELSFNDSGWLRGATGIGYGDDDDATELTDMEQTATNPGYLTVFLRKTFEVSVPIDFDSLILRVDFDDGFVAYLNGTEVARTNVAGANPAHNAAASGSHEAGSPVDFNLSAHRSLLRPGQNILAVQLHNASLTSSDASINPSLIGRKVLSLPPEKRIRGIQSLQQLAHVRGTYARRQLQAVLADFWDNHFTTDFDKVAEYLGELRNSSGRIAMTENQALAEAAQIEYLEYQFLHDHALGPFGDLLLFSATSPSQLIYLDNVLNVKGAANENYAREILELFAFGVDNRYTQEDIEQLAKCFTGWNIRKMWPDQKPAFPASARTPPTEASVQFQDSTVLGLGAGWKYFKGTQEPSPAAGGAASIAWTEPAFNDASWTAGSTGIGYGDNDDATTLTDMRNGYLSVYLRREFTLPSPVDAKGLMLSVDYDDGFVAYLNGREIARSQTMANTGTPPAFNRAANGSHEAAGNPDTFSLEPFASLLKPAPEKNILAIQVHNLTRDSSDLSLLPKLVRRQLLPGSIENGDPNGTWTFRFDPSRHDTNSKTLFRGTAHEIRVPGGRTGIAALRDAVDVIDAFVAHPSTAEFICLKLINKFVSDDISLTSYHDGTAAPELRQLMTDAIAAWNSTQPAGHIGTVLRTILRPATQDSLFWSRSAFAAKVKTPIEFINSSLRALHANATGTGLPSFNDELGMHLFTRDEPDGWSEVGLDWIDTGTMLARLRFAQDLPANNVNDVTWDAAAWARENKITTAESVVDHFDHLLFHDKLPAANRRILVDFATTDDTGKPLPFDPSRSDYAARLRVLVGMILSAPQWHFQ